MFLVLQKNGKVESFDKKPAALSRIAALGEKGFAMLVSGSEVPVTFAMVPVIAVRRRRKRRTRKSPS